MHKYQIIFIYNDGVKFYFILKCVYLILVISGKFISLNIKFWKEIKQCCYDNNFFSEPHIFIILIFWTPVVLPY